MLSQCSEFAALNMPERPNKQHTAHKMAHCLLLFGVVAHLCRQKVVVAQLIGSVVLPPLPPEWGRPHETQHNTATIPPSANRFGRFRDQDFKA